MGRFASGVPPSSPEVDDLAYAAVIASFGSMTPRRLQRILRGRAAVEVFADLTADRCRLVPRLMRPEQTPGHGGLRSGQIVASWRAQAKSSDPAANWERLCEAGIAVVRRGCSGYPARLVEDPAAPEVLFVRGVLAPVVPVDGPACVAIVGTRRSTHYGTDVASRLGRELAQAGVVVVSGLAAGVDAAAHEGALGALSFASPPTEVPCDRPASPVAIVGGGVDVAYPAKSARLYERVARVGALVSEAPPGAAPEPWRFPLRNRLIAALSHVVVVVESHEAGGALHTVAAADERGIAVMAVPGSVNSSASRGTNSLIADGCGLVRDVDDVLAAIALARPGKVSASAPRSPSRVAGADQGGGSPSEGRRSPPESPRGPRIGVGPGRATLGPKDRAVLAALEEVPVAFEVVASRARTTLPGAAAALERLADAGLARRGSPGGWERCDAQLASRATGSA